MNDIAYYTVNSFTTVDLGCEQGNNMGVNILKLESPASQAFIEQICQALAERRRVKGRNQQCYKQYKLGL